MPPREDQPSDMQSFFKEKKYNQLRLIFQSTGARSALEAATTQATGRLLQQLRAPMAKARLFERHQAVLRQKLFKLKQVKGNLGLQWNRSGAQAPTEGVLMEEDCDAGRYSP